MSRLATFAAIALLSTSVAAAADTYAEMFPSHAPAENANVQALLESFDYQQGKIFLPGGHAVLNVPDGYYYLDAEDASRVLVDLWGNPYGTEMGMIFPGTYTPWDREAWGAKIQWEAIGFVSDEDAATIDYSDLLVDMKRDTRNASKERERQGYGTMELIGWAEQPSYDNADKQLHWALELNFDGDEQNTLNYELRSLGRYGTLNLVFIGGLHQLTEIKGALPDVKEMVSFQSGQAYADFDPSIDTVAAVGIAGLIAGKAASKAGLLATGLLLLKKFWFVLLIPLAGLQRLFSGRRA